jgi:hypothetical protein
MSGKWIAGSAIRAARILLLIAALIAVLALTIPAVSQVAVAWPLAAKFLVTTILIAPAAFFMGMPFPTGLRRLEAWHKPSVRWAWALNAASSVLGSASAIFLAIYVGLRETLFVGGILYLAAALVLNRSSRRNHEAAISTQSNQ